MAGDVDVGVMVLNIKEQQKIDEGVCPECGSEEELDEVGGWCITHNRIQNDDFNECPPNSPSSEAMECDVYSVRDAIFCKNCGWMFDLKRKIKVDPEKYEGADCPVGERDTTSEEGI